MASVEPSETNDDLEPIPWIVEPTKVRELVWEANLLVVGRDDERDRRELRRGLDGRTARRAVTGDSASRGGPARAQ